MVAAFDVKDVLSNPARFDLKKAESINATHMRMLEIDDFKGRMVPYLNEAGLVSAAFYEELTEREQEILTAAAPLVQERMTLLGEAKGMVGFLFTADEDLAYDEESLAQVAKIEQRAEIVNRSIELIEGLESLSDPHEIQQALRAVLVDEMGVKPRLAFTPLRVAITGRRVSPPLFESMEILGKESSLKRLRAFSEHLGANA